MKYRVQGILEIDKEIETNPFYRKPKAVYNYCKKKGINIGQNFTLSSNNKRDRNFHCQPNKDVLLEDWVLVLNDIEKKILHIFLIPKNTFDISVFRIRNDKNQKIIMNFKYEDRKFIETNSKEDFRTRFYFHHIKY